MLNFGNRRLVEKKLKEKCRTDRARIQIGRISSFGLLEMSRQRLRESFVKWENVLTNESLALKLLKIVELKSISLKAKIVEIKVSKNINKFFVENFANHIKFFEDKNKIKIQIIIDNSLTSSDYLIFFKNKTKKIIEKIEKIFVENKEKNYSKDTDIKKNKLIHKKNIFKKNKFYKKKYYKKAKSYRQQETKG